MAYILGMLVKHLLYFVLPREQLKRQRLLSWAKLVHFLMRSKRNTGIGRTLQGESLGAISDDTVVPEMRHGNVSDLVNF